MTTETTETQAPTSAAEGTGKITFTDEQQQKVEQIVDKAVGRVAQNLRNELSAREQRIAELEAEVARARESRPAPGSKGDKKLEDLEATIEEMRRAGQSKAEEAERYKNEALQKAREVELARQESVAIRKTQVIHYAASKHNFVSLEAAQKLTQDSISYNPESGKFEVLNENGKPRLNASMEPMTVDEFFNDFAAKNKYLVRGDLSSGSGSSESMRPSLAKNGQFEVTDIFGPKSNAKLANDLALKDMPEYRRLRAIAVQSGLLAK